MSERKHIYEAGTKCWCGEPAPPAPPAAPDLADYQEWWSRQIPNNFKHESAVAIAYAQSKLARAESELERLKAENQRLREFLALMYDRWENGANCYEDPEDFTGFLGNAIKLSLEEENGIIAALSEKGSK